jgi:hypothetical protein
MNTQDDKIIKQFFQENKREIADTFFSRKVMQKIPARKKYEWLLILLAGLGSLLSYIFGKADFIRPDITLPSFSIPDISITMQQSTFIYILGGIILIPFITLIIYGLNTEKWKIRF